MHQALSLAMIYTIWRHLPADDLLPKLYIYIAVGVFSLNSLFSAAVLLYRNGLFSRTGFPRAKIFCQGNTVDSKDLERSKALAPIKIYIYLPRPVTIRAGQYISLWLPSFNLLSWAQTHPFMVISWSRGKQNTIELLVEPKKGITRSLARRACLMGPNGFDCLAMYSGPHGVTECVEKYETVLCVASGTGIAAILPYVKKLIHGYNTCTSHVRRVHVVWQVKSFGKV